MPPKATATTTAALSSRAPGNGGHKPLIPVALLIFLGLCLAYTLSYVLYRIVMSRRLKSENDTPDSSDRGVSQFMNGARLTLNFGSSHKSAPLALSESPNFLEEHKPLTDPPLIPHSDVPASSPAESSSTPFLRLVPSFTIHSNQELSGVQLRGEQSSPDAQASISAPSPAQRPFSQRIAAKVKFLSRDRAEAIALDPKLAPVQVPLRPLSTFPGPLHKKRTLFGLGLKQPRGSPETDSGTR